MFSNLRLQISETTSEVKQELSQPRPTLATSNTGGNYVDNEAYKRRSLASPYARTPTGQTRPQERIQSQGRYRCNINVLFGRHAHYFILVTAADNSKNI